MFKNSFSYLFSEGIRNIKMNRQMSLASIGVLIACMILIGGSLVLSIDIDALMGYVEDFNEIVVWVKDDITQNESADLEWALDHTDNITEVHYVSKTAALEELQQVLGSSSLVEGFSEYADDNPLPASYRIKINDIQAISQTESAIMGLDGVESIESSAEVTNTLSGVKTAIHLSSLIITGILIVVSIIIIANTVRITIFNRQEEISIMKLVGATNSFIRFPFLIEGMVIGLVSAVFAWGILWIGVHYFYIWLGSSASGWLQMAYQHLVPFSNIALAMLGGFALGGILFGIIGSFIFVSKYLRV